MKALGVSQPVLKLITPGFEGICAHCEGPIKFKAVVKPRYVICNVYVECECAEDCDLCFNFGKRWDRVELFHPDCYTAAGSPHGDPR